MDQTDSGSAAQMARQGSELQSLRGEIALISERVKAINIQGRLFFPDSAKQPDILELTVNQSLLQSRETELATERQRLTRAIANRAEEIKDVTGERLAVEAQLGVIDAERAAAGRELDQNQVRLRSLVGGPDEPDTVLGLESLISRAVSLPDQLSSAKGDILRDVAKLHVTLLERLAVIERLYRPAADFVAESELARDAGLEFVANLVVNDSWSQFEQSLDGRRNAELVTYLDRRLLEIRPEDAEDILATVDEAIVRLSRDRGSAEGNERSLVSAFKGHIETANTLSEFLGLSWVETQFSLTGHGLALDQLSPGERGLILLLFYLVVDRSDAPLLLDQPEENLDNAAVRKVLVPALQDAKSRRQVIVVTHNANLAVVGDADQVIHCSLVADKFVIKAGSLAQSATGEAVIEVLEGARPAFENRRSKYDSVVLPA